MVKVTRKPQEKHKVSLSPAVSDLVHKVSTVGLADLPALFTGWSQRWPYPRGDLNNWIEPLDRFDSILQDFNTKYGLDKGPQTIPFGVSLLLEGSPGVDEQRLKELGFGPEGDRELIEAILVFSKLLVEKCANRVVYNSTDRLNDLLNTTSFSLLHSTLRITFYLAQRYAERPPPPSNQPSKFYDFDHERLHTLSVPFGRQAPVLKRAPSSPVKSKLKEKSPQASRSRRASVPESPNSFRALCKDSSSQSERGKSASSSDRDWQQWAYVKVSWKSTDSEQHVEPGTGSQSDMPSTPTPVRRQFSSSLAGPQLDMSQEDGPPRSVESTPESDLRTVEYSPTDLQNASIETILSRQPEDMPAKAKYELLHQLRIAYGLMTSSKTRKELLAIRLLSIASLANVLGEIELAQRFISTDGMFGKPGHNLCEQLLDLLYEDKKTSSPVSLYLQTIAMETMGILAHHKLFAPDIHGLLGAGSAHGLLAHLTEKGLKDISKDKDSTDTVVGDDWRDAIFTLPRTVIECGGHHGRSSEAVIPASFVTTYLSGFRLTTGKALRVHLRMLDFIKTFFHHFKDGMATLLASSAFEAISNLLGNLANGAWDLFQNGGGIPAQYKTRATDYEIPYMHQQIIRSIIDMINDISGHQGAQADRVLRSLVDSQALLRSFRLIVDNLSAFGPYTWSEVVKAVCGFLHNEPTSYTVIAEAGIIQSLLDTVNASPEDPSNSPSAKASKSISSVPSEQAPGIPAAVDAIINVSQVFGAICLTTAGFDLFKSSGALDKFFEIFESPAHVKVLKDTNTLALLGSTFDEIVRHHPNLRTAVLSAVIVMLARVRHITRSLSVSIGAGPKLWLGGTNDEDEPSGGREALSLEIVPPASDASGDSRVSKPLELPNGKSLHIADETLPATDTSAVPTDCDRHGLSANDYARPAIAFLVTFFENQGLCTSFLENGGGDIVLDFVTLPSLPVGEQALNRRDGLFNELSSAVHMMAETKPNLILPVLADRLRFACSQLEHFSQNQPRDWTCYFSSLVKSENPDGALGKGKEPPTYVEHNGTRVAKSLMAIFSLSQVLAEVFNVPMYTTRSAQAYLFGLVNLADVFADISKMLGSISSACYREEIALQRTIPQTWLAATIPVHFSTGDDDVDRMLNVRDSNVRIGETGDESLPEQPPETRTESTDLASTETSKLDEEKRTPYFRNVQILRYLLIETPFAITEFLCRLGRGIAARRRPDTFTKQKIASIANALAAAYTSQLQPYFLNNGSAEPDASSLEANFTYLVIVLDNVRRSFYDESQPSPGPMTTSSARQTFVIEAFRQANGLKILSKIGTDFYDQLKACKLEHSTLSANTGLKICLDILDEFTSAKSIMDSAQSVNMRNADPSKALYFVPAQVLLNLRMEALPMTQLIWESDYADQASRDVVQKLVSILKHILTGDHEHEAIQTNDSRPEIEVHPLRKHQIDEHKVNTLKDKGYTEDLVREAIYRTNTTATSSIVAAEEYCKAFMSNPRRRRLPIPSSELDVTSTNNHTPAVISPPTSAHSNPLTLALSGLQGILDAGNAEAVVADVEDNEMRDVGDTTISEPVSVRNADTNVSTSSAMDIQNILNADSNGSGNSSSDAPPPDLSPVYSVESIDAVRDSIREDLAERCNNILNTHQDLTFELYDLIASATKKLSDVEAKDYWRTTTEILVSSLLSMQVDEDINEGRGKKIAAAAHLVALLFQDGEVFTDTLNIYQESFEGLVSFLKLPQSHGRTTEDSFPWVAPVLLIVEKMLSRDSEPAEVKWEAPNDVEPCKKPVITPTAIFSLEEKQELLAALINMLNRVGKDKAMALAITRVLVILTRTREIAASLGEKRNLQRLFMMVKQLAHGIGHRVQSTFMIILRHIMEDEHTLKQIMRSEISAAFTGRNSTRHMDTTSYVRDLYHLVVRSPDTFVQVTEEMVKLSAWPPHNSSSGLVLKESATAKPESDAVDSSVQPTASVEAPDDLVQESKGKGPEVKPPTVEHPDGVIHFILSELDSYKDVDDKEVAPEKPNSTNPNEKNDSAGNTDVPATTSDNAIETTAPSKPEKVKFRPEDHPIFSYRCFLMYSLTELLHSYNRAKIELINFSKKADPMVATPSKPRSYILNYFLHRLIPSCYVDKEESLHFKKKLLTSDWAIRVVVALCSKTGETGLTGLGQRNSPQSLVDDLDTEPELTFVRRFVLEHAIKTYKDAISSTEPLQMKYSRLLCLADTFNRLLTKPAVPDGSAGSHNNSYKVLGRMMFEKNMTAILTSSLVDIDLSYPGSKRVIKFILRPLQELTTLASQLSLTAPELLISGVSTVPDNDISSASSVSDVDDDREETPDLFRNSALGMLDPNHDHESDSESDEEDEDEEMYDDEYGDEMEYDNEMLAGGNDDEAVSDEDVDEEMTADGPIEGLPGDVPMDIEFVVNDPHMDIDSDEDDEDDEEEDSDEDDDDEEDGEDFMIEDDDGGEINGDDENNSLNDGLGEDEGEWEDEGEDDQEEGASDDQNGVADITFDGDDIPLNGHGNGNTPAVLSSLLRVLEDHDMDGPIGMPPNIPPELIVPAPGSGEPGDEDEDDEEDDEGEEMDENDMVEYDFDHFLAGGGDDFLDHGDGFGWNEFSNFARRHRPRGAEVHPPHFGRRNNDIHHMGRPARMHGGPTGRAGADDGTNPLLRRPHAQLTRRNPEGPVRHGFFAPGLSSLQDLPGFPGFGGAFQAVLRNGDTSSPHGSLLDNLVQAFNGRTDNRPIFSFTGSQEEISELSRVLARPSLAGFPHRHHTREENPRAGHFVPATTTTRWQEESRILFGALSIEKSQRVQILIMSVLVPPAQEEEKEKRRKREEQEKAEREEEERLRIEGERLKKEAEAKEAAAKAEADRLREEAEAEAAARRHEAGELQNDGDTEPMEDVQSAEDSTAPLDNAAPTEDGDTESQPRIFTTIRGRQLDITGLSIDIDYLEALPEELREEVIMQQYATRREEARQEGNHEPSGIDPDFLNALPDDIREEMLQQEAHAQRRREREAARRQAAASATPAQAEEMDSDNFLATLDPNFRRVILAEQPPEVLRHLNPQHAAEGRAHARRYFPYAVGGDRDDRGDRVPVDAPQRDNKRQIIQMVDKAGVATLLRLMFLQQQGSLRANLWQILRNICGNRQTRFEVISLLLVVLKEGSTDVGAIERSLANLSLRAKATVGQKTPQPLRRTLSMQPNGGLSEEVTPLVVIQQCLSALKQLSSGGFHIRSIFLREVDISPANKKGKGKGKEAKTAKYPINDLIGLLDRKLIVESSFCLQLLAELLAAVTSPLPTLLRKDKEKAAEEMKQHEAESGNADTQNSSASGVGPTAAPTQDSNADRGSTAAGVPAASTSDVASAAADGGESSVKPDADQEVSTSEESKVKKIFEPPEIFEHNLELVVRIFVAPECNSDTFHSTLETLLSLSSIPGTAEAFSKELISHVKLLSQLICVDLDELIPHLKEAQLSTDLHNVASAKFSNGGSDQVKLLRVLQALDYLSAPKKDNEEPGDNPVAKSILTSSYESLSLGPLWTKLSDSLTVIQEKDNMISFANILLPLIESLMVVCKNTSLKDSVLARQVREQAPGSPVPEAMDGLEELFFNFTTEHRKILNDIIRQSPKLMQGNGSFSLLVKNPKVLDFDNKRAYFTKQIHSRLHQQRHIQPPLQLNIRRDQVFLDSYKALYYKSAEEMKYGKLNIRFNGEEGVDAGGVTREWFQVLARGMFNPDWALWQPVAADRTTFHPNPLSWINGEHLLYFKFIGRIIGKALHEGRVLDAHFSRAVYKRLLGKEPSLKDLESMDLDYYKSLLWILENDITEVISEDFSVIEEQFGEEKVVDLIPNGRNIPVTDENKREYVNAQVRYRLTTSVKDQLENFVRGFHDIIPAELIAIFDEQELELLISGLPEIDVDDWRANTEYHNYTANSPQVTWFWRIVRGMSNEEKAKLLQFVTGTSKVPLNGFKDLEGMQGNTLFSIHKDPSQTRLPTSHTCFNQLDLPSYDDYDTLKSSLMTAINLGADYFGFA
ncbi:hypothetical protein LTR84_002076 [Exophiala bonariae]|uniref:HECT-type E3 ubiquitin transferase n=1 Tax=Exophiala bonariae TaxID=1690606 RepID=A0AAV9NE80_9EURO|nr:hypothetical protein LTR84_002076 [Exophiala bonariae]